MIGVGKCPSHEKMEQLAAGAAPAQEITDFADHLEDCPQCAVDILMVETYQRLAGEVCKSVRMAAKYSSEDRFYPQAHQATVTETATSTNEIVDMLAPAQMPGELGRFGSFRILEVLGAGGMGVVFQAEDIQLKRRVALKVMRHELAAQPAYRERFLREAQAAAALEHDHIVSIYQVGEERGMPFFAMQCLKGLTLGEWLGQQLKVSIPHVLRLGRQIALGLDVAHQCGLVHRDIKPANLWLEPEHHGDERRADSPVHTKEARADIVYRIKILDFGLARPIADSSQLTQQGAILGTPAYMAPEQASGAKPDHRCDLFSFGVVLYQMCTGQLPFRGDNVLAQLSALAVLTPPRPQSLNPEVPTELDALVMQLLAKAPADRPATARLVADRLQALEDQVLRSFPNPEFPKVLSQVESTGSKEGRSATVEAMNSLPPPPALLKLRPRALLAVGIALLLLLPLAFFFGPQIIRIATNKGELVIESDEPNLVVTVKGATALVHDKVKDRRFVLSAGDYDVEVREQGEGGLRFDTRRFTITRGGKEVFRAQLVPADRIKAAQRILALGGKLTVRAGAKDWDIKIATELPPGRFKVVAVNFDGCQKVTDALLAHLQPLTDVRSLSLARTNVSDDHLVQLGRHEKLAQLNLAQTRISNEGLAHLKPLANLRTLDLQATHVEDDGLEHLKELKNLKELNLQGTPLTDDGLRHLKSLANLHKLILKSVPLNGNGLAHLKPLSLLRVLDLDDTNINNEGLAHLQVLTGLKGLGLSRTKVTDGGLAALKPLINLESLRLDGTKVRGPGLEHLKSLLELAVLGLAQTGLNDEGMSQLKGLVNLRALNLSGTRIRGAGLENLDAMQHLHTLYLDGTAMNDAGLDYLKKLPNLRKVYLSGSRVTAAAVVALRNALPQCGLILDERQTAEWLLLLGGKITILAAKKEREISRAEELPAGPFQVVGIIDVASKGNYFTNADLPYLQPLSNLKILHLENFAKVSDAGLVNLQPLTNLQDLYLAGNGISGWEGMINGEGLVHLKPLKKLKKLSLAYLSVRDAGLAQLQALTSLRELDLGPLNISDSGLVYLKPLTELTYLKLFYVDLTGAGLAHIQSLTKMKELHLSFTKLTDTGLKYLEPLTNLTSLNLGSTQVTDAGLKHLQALTNLQQLSLQDCPQVTNTGLAYLKSLRRLENLHLSKTKVSDAGLRELATLTNLNYLSLSDTQVTDAGLAHLKPLGKLVNLDLAGTQIKNGGLAELVALSRLNMLDLRNTAITDTGLEHLKRGTFYSVDLRGTKVTLPGVEALRKARPNSHFYFSPTGK